MIALKNKTAATAVLAGLSLTLAACGGSSSTPPASSGSSSSAPAAKPTPAAAISSLTGVQTAVTLDKKFLDGITGLGLTPGTIGGAKLDATTGVISFPITGGNVTYYDPASGVTPYVQGMINHVGSGLSLSAGGKTVKLEDFVVDPAKSVLTGKVTVNDKVFAPSADLFILDGKTLKPLAADKTAGTAVLDGTTVTLTKTAADALNMVFGVQALTQGFPVGIAKITVALPKS